MRTGPAIPFQKSCYTWTITYLIILCEWLYYKYVYRGSSPNMVSPNMDFTPTHFWFRDKKIRIYTVINAIPRSSSAIIPHLFIVSSQSPQTVRFRLTRFFSGPKMRVRRGPPVYQKKYTYIDVWCKRTLILKIFKTKLQNFSHLNVGTYTVWSEGFLYKVAPPELKISLIIHFVIHNSVVLSQNIENCCTILTPFCLSQY